MKNGLFGLCLLISGLPAAATALEVKHTVQTTIGVFDACAETFDYAFYNNRDYDVKTTIVTTGSFGTLYPFKAAYHSVGTYEKSAFKPQSYFNESHSLFHDRQKEIVYQNGIPVKRISTKNDYTRHDAITVDSQYESSNDLLSTFAELTYHIRQTGNCDFSRYSFNGKRYSKSIVKTVGTEKLKTPYFKGKALKCQYALEVLDDAAAGFLIKKDEPIYFWVLRDDKTQAPFLARILIASTPFGQLEALTTKIEVKP